MTYLLFLLSNYFVLNIKNITLDVKLASYSASFYISSLNEFVRVKSFSGEKNVITFLLDEISLGDLESFTVAQLKELLKKAGKPVSGKKAELIARLSE